MAKEPKAELDILHAHGIDANHREIYLVGESDGLIEGGYEEPGVEFRMAGRFIKNLRYLAAAGNGPIYIHMKTCGGDVNEGFAIYDAIRLCTCRITILSYTHARSMSSIILQAADTRLLMPHSYFMFHRGTLALEGEWQAVESGVSFYHQYGEYCLRVYAAAIHGAQRGPFKGKTTKIIKQELDDMMNRKTDVFLTATTAVAWGLADAIYTGGAV